MIDDVYAAIEARILAWETARRGRRHAAASAADQARISTLGDLRGRTNAAKVISFDLFDTLLLRRALGAEETARKTAGFARLIAGPAAGGAIWAARHELAPRMKAEMIAAGEGDEPPLARIFERALTLAGTADANARAERLAAFEAAVEAQNLVAAPGAAALLADLKAEGLHVIAVSDMHLAGAAIQACLVRAGLGGAFDRVFVSSDHGVTKQGGGLFPLVAAALGVEPEEILHVGDRLDGDVAPARRAGWRALHYAGRAGIAACEARRVAESYTPSPTLRRRQVARALDTAADREFRSAEDVVEQLIGPACGALVLAALGRASRIGARRLFHLSRDGAVLGRIADQAIRLHPHLAPVELECSELAVSRAQGALLSLRDERDLPTLAQLVPYLVGAPLSAESLADAFGLPEDAFSPALRAAEGEAFVAALADPRSAGPLTEALGEARGRVEGYLQGAGALDPAPAVAMDIGYAGAFAAQLTHLFHAAPAAGRRLEFMFLTTSAYLNGTLRRLHPQIALHSGVVLDHRRREARWATLNFAWLEPFLTDPDRGRLTGYAEGAPVFAPGPLAPEAAARARVIREAIGARALRFIDEFHAAPGDLEDAARIMQRRMAHFAGRPRRREVRAVRSLAHLFGQVGDRAKDPTRPVNWLRLASELRKLRAEDYWVQGSLGRSGLGLVNLALAERAARDDRADPRFRADAP